MKKFSGIIWGIVLITVGILFAGKSLHLFDFDIFFDGWWTLFIIIPSFIGLITDKDKSGSLIGLTAGVLLLLACQKVIAFDLVWKLLVTAIIIIIGFSLLFKSIFNKNICGGVKKSNNKIGKDDTITAIFSSQDLNADGQEFNGTELTAIFGGIDLDLRNAKIKDGATINATAIFGGIDIKVSDDVEIVLKSDSVFGGADNTKSDSKKDKKNRLYINATCIFGGLEIK